MVVSGIFGITNEFSNRESAGKWIQKMLVWNRAYGREKEVVSIGDSVALGCCYEKIANDFIDCSDVLRRRNKCAVIDALLYNRRELLTKCKLQDSVSDEELLFSYIDSFGMESLKNVNGDFCGALYNEQEHTLTLFRDHIGIRPLFYYSGHGFVAFSTDIRALLTLDQVDASLNEEWIYRSCGGYYMDGLEWTEYDRIFCVRPASYMTFSFQNGDTAIKKSIYWHLGKRKIRFSTFGEYKNKMKELVMDAVKSRLDAVPGLVGAELSGGLDSGVIDILIHQLGRECLYHSWSVNPEELPYAKDDERLIIADICKQENIACHFSNMESDFSINCNLAKNMQESGIVLEDVDYPVLRYVLPPYINALTLSETSEYMKRNGVKAIFTGHGGDEGISHRCNPYELFYHHEYYHFFRQVWFISKGQKHRFIYMLKKIRRILGESRQHFFKPFVGSFGAPELLKRSFREKHSEKDMPLLHFAYDPIAYILEGGSRNRLDNVSLLGAYNGVRYLVPYLDYRVIDFAVSIPRYLYLHGASNRFLFREAFKDIMPESLYNLRRKEDGSAQNYPSNPNWFEEFKKKKRYIAERLDRNFWAEYLDFDVIDTWAEKGEPNSEERHHENSILMRLFYFTMAQNLIEKSKIEG